MKNVSFLIPAKNEELYIGSLIRSIREHMMEQKQDNYEIIVADNGSTDNTWYLAEHFADTAIRSNADTVAGVRNSLAKVADGRLLVFLDADVGLSDYWFHYLQREAHAIVCDQLVVGFQCVPPRESMFYPTWAEGLSRPSYTPGANTIVSAATFHVIGGFCERLSSGEDVDFCRRAERDCGFDVVIPDGAVVHKGAPTSIKGFFRQQRWHGAGDTSSLASFAKSLIAIYSMLVVCVVCAALVTTILAPDLAPSLYLVLALLLTFFSLWQFPLLSLRNRPMNIVLSLVYMVARCSSITIDDNRRPYEGR